MGEHVNGLLSMVYNILHKLWGYLQIHKQDARLRGLLVVMRVTSCLLSEKNEW